jgi:hypothetical protein
MLILIVIAITWLAIATLVVALCRAAARGDEQRALRRESRSAAIDESLVLSTRAGAPSRVSPPAPAGS